MSYRVRTESFEGPFDLLLYLVNRQRIDIGSINISQIAGQYLDEIARMRRLDLDVASDFLVVASTLLEIKASSLIPDDRDEVETEFADLAPDEARDILFQRLLAYKQFKNAAAALGSRYEMACRSHPRTFGAPPEFLNLYPDYLDGVELADLARYYVNCYSRRDAFLLESEHIAGKPIAVETYVASLHRRIRRDKRLMFTQMLPPEGADAAVVVVTFLAVLELMKRNMVTARQDAPYGDIELRYVEGSGELNPGDLAEDYGA